VYNLVHRSSTRYEFHLLKRLSTRDYRSSADVEFDFCLDGLSPGSIQPTTANVSIRLHFNEDREHANEPFCEIIGCLTLPQAIKLFILPSYPSPPVSWNQPDFPILGSHVAPSVLELVHVLIGDEELHFLSMLLETLYSYFIYRSASGNRSCPLHSSEGTLSLVPLHVHANSNPICDHGSRLRPS
jgi:hypothetical protein